MSADEFLKGQRGRQMNMLAAERRHGTTDDAYTPPWIFDTLGLRFDLDVAAPTGGIPWVPADRYLTIDDDALSCEWSGRVWMNPPYSKPKPWVTRFLDHGNGVALLPTTVGEWFLRLWSSDCGIVALPPVRFVKESGPMRSALPSRCWLFAVGDENIAALAAFGKVR